ncbi:MAG TPA: cupredoxin domain-containing protein [Actinomycetota bacterium]|nr:cupredoxin domain-containing protein [Actinomycetota bacterium]
MADPEEIYKEVLAEEQAKGSSAPVAEGRAKAARQRAHEGSPHPKEAKWWPGSQPQFEGGDGGGAAAPAAEEAEEPAEAEEAPAEEAPAAEAPAAEAPAAPAEPVAEPQELTRDQPAAPAAAPAQPAAATAPVPAGVAAATATLPSGVTHGTPSGNRLRPEDAVTTESQFDGQAAVRQRRKMIDELVASGVPAVSARSSERRGGGAGMLLLYLLIPALAVFFLVSNETELAGGSEGGETQEQGGGGEGGGGLTISAANVAFDTDTLTIPADGGELLFVNDDSPSVPHNVAIYEDDSAETEIFVGDQIPGGQEITYQIPSHEPGEYYFQCDVHPAMNGTATFE